ncbi:MAG: hypothetical protein QOG02_459 [Gaiellales bacterium]|nr:hypothetical protein [Gaiellales bacterium]MDX6544685.1 hypothetical protein [Gaiellales bacterium]
MIAADHLRSPGMLAPGDPAPDLTLFGVDAEPVRILDLAPLLIAFYLYDWTGT